jgi:hypothetical protein
MEEEKEKMRKAEEEILKERRDENDKQELAYVEFMNRVSSLYNKGLGYLVKGNGIIKTGSDNADELPNLVQQCRDINKVFEEMRVQYPLYSATIDRHLLPENSITRLSFFSVFLRYGTIIEEDPTTKMNEMIRSIQVLKRGRRSTGHAIIQAVNYATDVLQAVSDLMAGFPDFANRSWVDTQSDDVKDLISRFMEAEDTANEVMSLATDFREDEDANERANERVRLELSDRRKRISDAFNSAHAKGSTLYNDKKHMKDIYDASVDFNTDILTKYESNGVDDLLFSPKDIANAHIRYVIAGTVLTSDTIQIMRIGEAKVDRLKREGKIDEATTVAQKVVQYAKSVIGTLETVSSDLPEVREGGEFHPWYNERYTFAQTVIERFDPDGTLGIPKEEDGKPKVEDSKPKEDSRPKRDQLPYNRWRIDFIQPVINEFRKLISGRLASRSKQVPSRESIGKLLVLATNIIVRSKKLELIQLSKAASDLPKIDVEGKTYLHFIEAVVKAQTVADLTDEEVIDAMKLREFFEKVKASLGLSGEESRLIDRFVEKLYE